MGDGGVACAPLPIPESALKPFKQMRKGEDADRRRESEKDRKLDGVQVRRTELEIGEFVPERHRRGKLEDGEVHERNGELEKGEVVQKKWRKSEVEAGEFIPRRWRKDDVQKGDSAKSEFGLSRRRNVELGKEEKEREREHSPDVNHQRKDGGCNDNDYRKRSSSSLNWDHTAREKEVKKCLQIPEEGLAEIKHESSNGKSGDREHNGGGWSKWPSAESKNSNHKHHAEPGDQLGSKSHRKSEESNRSTYPERSYKNASSSSTRASTTGRNSSCRYQESSLPSRGSDRQGRRRGHTERSPHERERSHHHDHRDRSPCYIEWSPRDRTHHSNHRDRTPNHSGRSPCQRSRHHEDRDRTSGHHERSPHDRGHTIDNRESSRKSKEGEKQQISRYEERAGRRDYSDKDSLKDSSLKQSIKSSSSRTSDDRSNKEKMLQNISSQLNEPSPPPPPPLPPPPPPPVLPPPPPPLLTQSTAADEQPSMEEDMDICDTPPHAGVASESNAGKWSYLDHFGVEQGPSRLVDLRRLMDEGLLQTDHLIKHAESDRWVTVEKAASPLVHSNMLSVVSDVVTQMVSPPEAPGNLLVEPGDPFKEVSTSTFDQQESQMEDASVTPDTIADFHIDKRVDALMDGYTIVSGKELETIGEALNTTFEPADWENWNRYEGFTRFQERHHEFTRHSRDEGMPRGSECLLRENGEVIPCGGSSDWFSGRWSCRGGDWKRNDEVSQDRSYRRKLVLNEGFPLCQMPTSSHEDPRWHRKDDLYYPSRIKKLDLPLWAFSSLEENNESSSDLSKAVVSDRSGQIKQLTPRGVKGTILPVIRINACVVKDHTSSESRVKVRSSDRHPSRSSRSHSMSSDRSSIYEGSYRSGKHHEDELQKLRNVLNVPSDHVCTVDELSVNLGDWYYLDGAGYEHGPSSFSELQELVAKGTILEQSSVFRKVDNTWLPVASDIKSSEVSQTKGENRVPTSNSSLIQSHASCKDNSCASNSFHSLHPQFIGYARGKLHELVMKSYKNREFAAAINEVLDPWITEKQPKKEMETHFPFNSSITKSSVVLSHDLSGNNFWRSEDGVPRSAKRARLLADESDGDSEMEEDLLNIQKNNCSFEDICGEVIFSEDSHTSCENENEGWGLLNGHILARVFHFLRTDVKSLLSSAATCKRWNTAAKFYKSVSHLVDLSSAGPKCTDKNFRSIMDGYDKKKITSLVLTGCCNVSASTLEEILQIFPCISYIDIRNCSQFVDLKDKFQHVKWVKNFGSSSVKRYEESYSKIRSLKQITEKGYSTSKKSKGLGYQLDDSDEMGDFDYEPGFLDRKDSSSLPFRQGFYKRSKLLDARKSSGVLSRDAQMRQWLQRKSENGYRKIEDFVASSLKDIMKGNRFDFFIPKVAKIEDRIRSGYYVHRGLSSIKDDISRMCRDALKAKNQGETGDMKQIIMSFIQLAKRLENPRFINGRDEYSKSSKDSPYTGQYFSDSKYKRKQTKAMSEKKGMNRNSITNFANGEADYKSHAFDKEIKRSLSKLKKRNIDSESETSDGFSEDDRGEGESTESDTESDSDVNSSLWDIKGVCTMKIDDSIDSMSDDREWGARMTKASLVPPITRKYEVIDEYLIIADKEEVQRKMRVALPDDYSEKMLAQKSGTEDMDIPEVKEYKPRKMLGAEVLEQEVYGIDPYTHNLILDSMPEDPDWTIEDKQNFIEEFLLSTLNKQVRHFTGTGNTPMVYPLQPVIEETQKAAEEISDSRIVKMCQAILKAMRNRSDDNYVAYRKGLGVVCNKEEGFGLDDFVVEFLGEVYPAWKWFEKQDGIRSLQKNSQDPAPEFYNIYLERPKGDQDGYDLVVVDAMHKANYASRICHSCRPNCEAKVTAVDGQYQIGIYTVRPIAYGEEITFDYNSVTESKEEYEASVCLCGTQICRGSYLNLSGEEAYQKVMKECHGLLDRHKLMLEACEVDTVSRQDYIDLGKAGLGTCLLAGLPDWLIAYSAHLVRYIDFERKKLPDEILKHNLEEKRKFFSDIDIDIEKKDAEIQAEGVSNARLQNVALTLDKVRYVMRCVFGDPKKAPPPLEKLSAEGIISVLWKGEGSLVEELLHSMAPHVEADLLKDLKSKIHVHDPSGSENLERELRKSLLWLRDELRSLPCTCKCRHDGAADLIHMYAYTKYFFKIQEYNTVKSPPVYISPLDLGPKYADKMGSGLQEYCKTYGENYCLGQLIYWYSQTNAEPDSRLARARKGCLSLPTVSSFYAKSQKPLRENIYGSRTMRFMLLRMEKQPQRPWPEDRIWAFKSSPKFFGSPMLDAVLNKRPLDKEMMHWLKSRPNVFQGSWDG
ncbi:histone-lysine N-methyltransferase ATXR3 [Typha angustifolia]|uniref:histone-lysine N-methyltransferase ATXR3 n=1 Tax=Typha angustifolia TaxID=59011 RepID=UPI003C302292